MKALNIFIFCIVASSSFAQKITDIFKSTNYNYTYLGIDYSHAKFEGTFTQFSDAGYKGVSTIKNQYFKSWNNVVVAEHDKYSFETALRKEYITYNLDDIFQINAGTVVENMEGSRIKFSKEDIQLFINESEYSITEGIGILFIAEYLDKNRTDACFHFVMVNMSSKNILIHERMTNAPGGFGLRNYWIRPIYLSIRDIRNNLYKGWKNQYAK